MDWLRLRKSWDSGQRKWAKIATDMLSSSCILPENNKTNPRLKWTCTSFVSLDMDEAWETVKPLAKESTCKLILPGYFLIYASIHSNRWIFTSASLLELYIDVRGITKVRSFHCLLKEITHFWGRSWIETAGTDGIFWGGGSIEMTQFFTRVGLQVLQCLA